WPDWAADIRDEDLPPPRPEVLVDAELPPIVREPETIEERRQFAGVAFELDLDDLPPNEGPDPRQMRTLRTALAAAGEAWKHSLPLSDLRAGRAATIERPILLQPLSDSNVKFRLVARVLRGHAMISDEESPPDEAQRDSR